MHEVYQPNAFPFVRAYAAVPVRACAAHLSQRVFTHLLGTDSVRPARRTARTLRDFSRLPRRRKQLRSLALACRSTPGGRTVSPLPGPHVQAVQTACCGDGLFRKVHDDAIPSVAALKALSGPGAVVQASDKSSGTCSSDSLHRQASSLGSRLWCSNARVRFARAPRANRKFCVVATNSASTGLSSSPLGSANFRKR